MLIKERVVDYIQNKKEVDKWIALKGECKYEEFANILEAKGISCNWSALDNLARYDKRLLINVFKYMSFFEDYIRAIVWNRANKSYKSLENLNLREVINYIPNIAKKEEQLDYIFNNVEYICELRNQVSHNKIMLMCEKDGKKLKELLTIFKEVLPIEYQDNFKKNINGCAKDLDIDKKIIVVL